MHRYFFQLLICALLVCFSSCNSVEEEFTIEFEKYTLENGLEVILHKDDSDPIVAVTTLVHVGSSREKPGRTGFAHFFEHMSFNDSENVPRGANRKMIPELGGVRNGGTWSDGTIYYEVVPKDAFEKILWIDSDRMGFMINTVTDEALEREKQVVKNEKRERVDNNPYGHTGAVIRENLYPEGHPYNWTVIGDLEDLQAATLDDVKEFYEKYYGANNTTLVIAGDIDIAETKKLVEKWFSEIRRGPVIEPLSPIPVTLKETRSLYYEDNFAKLPELRMVYPTIESYHDDSYALQVLGEILSGSKESPLYKVIVEEKKLAPSIYAGSSPSEIAGEFAVVVRANAETDLDSVKAAIELGFSRFEIEGFKDVELTRIKAKIETDLYNNVETVLNKSYQLATYNEFAGDPGYITTEANLTRAVTRGDVVRVYNQYIKNKYYVMTSFVPKGQSELAVVNSLYADVKEEEIINQVNSENVSQGDEAVYEKTKTQYDRSEPPLGEVPIFVMPEIWQTELGNGMRTYGILSKEIPLVRFDISFKGGQWLDPIDKTGIAGLLSDLLMEGTINKTPNELEQAIELLGASINFSSGKEDMRISVNTLSRNFEKTLHLVEEILFEPRWDEKEFDRLKRELVTRIRGRESNPTAISRAVNQRLLYGDGHIFGKAALATPSTIENISLDDLQQYYNKNFNPGLASFHIVGDIQQNRALAALTNFSKDWSGKPVDFPEYKPDPQAVDGNLYFVDVPGSKQSVIRMSRLVLPANHPDYNNLDYADQIMGGGSSGRLFQLLRIEKGYTYGAFSFMGNTQETAPYIAYTSVRANVTRQSLDLIRELYENYAETFTVQELELTKNKIIKDNTRKYESLSAKLNVLRQISKFGYSSNFIEKNQKELLEMTLDDFHLMIETYLNEDEMFYLIVGDAKTQVDLLNDFGNTKAIMVDIRGNPL